MIDTSEGPFPIAAEKVERPPAECGCACGPPAVEEPTAVVNEAQPTPRGHIARWFVRIKPRKSVSPGTRRAAVILRNGGPFFLGVGPGLGRIRYENAALFKLFKMFKTHRLIRLLNILNVLNRQSLLNIVS